MKIKTIVASAAIAIASSIQAQTTISEADQETIAQAIEQADNGKADKAAATLEKMCRQYPTEAALRYELGYALMKDYQFARAAETFRSLRSEKEMGELPYQMEGNALDLAGRRGDAVRAYKEGLKRYPKSGALLMELGTIRMHEEDYAGALEMYAQGIEAAPDYAPNYYRAAWIHFHSDAPWDGIALAEHFIMMEIKGPRVEEMSRLTFDAYAAMIRTAVAAGGDDNTIARAATELGYDPKDEETTLTLRVISGVKKALHASMPEEGTDERVWKFEEALAGAGHWDAYVRWLLRKGREKEFTAWMSLHESMMEAFALWLADVRGEEQPHHI